MPSEVDDPSYRESAYRHSARVREGPARRPALRLVALAGAGLLAIVALTIGVPAARSLLRDTETRRLDDELGPVLRDPVVLALADRFEPDRGAALDRPASTVVMESSSLAETSRGLDRATAGRGLVIRLGRHLHVDPAHAELPVDRRARVLAEVSWVALVRSTRMPDAYQFGARSVDVRRLDVAVVDVGADVEVARVAIEAVPPVRATAAVDVYEVDPATLAAEVERALASAE